MIASAPDRPAPGGSAIAAALGRLKLEKRRERLGWSWRMTVNRTAHRLGHESGVDPALVDLADRFGYLIWSRSIRTHLKGKHVLDLGCGRGLHWAGFLLAGAKSYTGVDPRIDLDSREARNLRAHRLVTTEFTPREVMRRLPRVGMVPGTLADLDPKLRFDVAVLHTVTEHLMRIDDVFAELASRLRPGGRIVFKHHNFYAWNGHHRPPQRVDAILPGDPEQATYVDWAHVGFDPPPGHYLREHLNRIRLDELRVVTERHFRILSWREDASLPQVGGLRLAPAIMARYPHLSERELRTQTVFCVATA